MIDETETRAIAAVPDDLERYFVDRANAGDVDGLVELYEPDACIVCNDGTVVTGRDQIRTFFGEFLAERPKLDASEQAPAICNGDIALTSSRHGNGDISAEVARRQKDGRWLWVIDRFRL